MGTCGEIFIRFDDKILSLEDDLNVSCSKTANRIAWDLGFYDFIKQTYFMDSFLGQPPITNYRDYIHELDIEKWQADDRDLSKQAWGLGLMAGLSKLPGVRVFFRNEYCDCTGMYGLDESEKWALEGRAIDFTNSPHELTMSKGER